MCRLRALWNPWPASSSPFVAVWMTCQYRQTPSTASIAAATRGLRELARGGTGRPQPAVRRTA